MLKCVVIVILSHRRYLTTTILILAEQQFVCQALTLKLYIASPHAIFHSGAKRKFLDIWDFKEYNRKLTAAQPMRPHN